MKMIAKALALINVAMHQRYCTLAKAFDVGPVTLYLDPLKYVPGGTNVSGNACYIWTAPKKSVPTCVCTAASSELSAKVELTFFSAAKVTTVKRLKILLRGLALIDNEF